MQLLGTLTAMPLTGLRSALLTLPAMIRGPLMANLKFLCCTTLMSMVNRSLL